MKGAGTDEETLIDIIVTQAEVRRTPWAPPYCFATTDVIYRSFLVRAYLQKE